MVWIKGYKTNYMTNVESENQLESIETNEATESMLKLALTFKPEEYYSILPLKLRITSEFFIFTPIHAFFATYFLLSTSKLKINQTR